MYPFFEQKFPGTTLTKTEGNTLKTRELSRRRFVEMAGMLGASAMVSPALLHAVEPHVQDKSYNTLTEEEEIALGRKFSAEYEKKAEILHNPVIDAYLNHVIRRLGDASQRPHWPYQVKVV